MPKRNYMTVKKQVDKPIKFKGKSYTARELSKKLNVKGKVDISRKKTWFSDIMNDLDKKEQ